ncbi:B mating type-like pheromone [Gelatoporia subvermispora B]|uniref:B mating type-like pheromone n=1 Tax=Ceriporiopsis subvermispora (strain B) TaxID=914234 RepID=M2R9V8_CERS8|nr:B mating type-like pheromone [Gelatoporia subvermispora B]
MDLFADLESFLDVPDSQASTDITSSSPSTPQELERMDGNTSFSWCSIA